MTPRVSIIVPCFNEEATIATLLEALLHQTFPRNQMEVVIAEGYSQDSTLEVIEAFRTGHRDLEIRVVRNRARTIPSALNCAIREARGELIVRLDAHSRPRPDYVSRCVHALDAGLGENVGGVWEIAPRWNSWIARAIARAGAHPLGAGDARYRIGSRAALVDTVPFGAFRRQLWTEIGGFDESLLTNEDYEFNARIRKAGGRVWLDPSIVSVYYARATLAGLAGQYWRYGYWKFRMLRRYPETLRWRQALPPVLVLSLVLMLALSWWPPARFVLAVEIGFYVAALAFAGMYSAVREKKAAFLVGLPLAIATMHLAWGAGFLASAFSPGSWKAVDGR